MTGLIFEAPPDRASRSKWVLALSPLMAHRGRWARVLATIESCSRATAHNLRKGRYHRPPGLWEFRSGPLQAPSGRHTHGVWARYLGPELDEPRKVEPVRADPLRHVVDLTTTMPRSRLMERFDERRAR